MTISNFIGKFPEGKKNLILPEVQYWAQKKCSLKPNWDHKLLIMESYIEISPVFLEFWSKKEANELSDNFLEFYKDDVLFLLLCY